MKTQFETSGDLRYVDVLAAFVSLWRRRATGSVSFSRAGASASFDFAEGEVVSVSSAEARFESAAILVRAGKLDAAALERLAISDASDGALAALQAGILTKREWRWGEKIRAIEVLADLLGWPDGKYYFDTDARSSAGAFTVTIPRLLLELFLRSRDRNLVEHQLGPSDAPLVRSPDFEREFSTFGLTADAESVVRLIDGRATADEIARAAPADEFAVRKLLAALTTLGLIEAQSARRGQTPPEEAAGAGAGGRSHSEAPPSSGLAQAAGVESAAPIEPDREDEDQPFEAAEEPSDERAAAAADLEAVHPDPVEAPGDAAGSRWRPTAVFDFDPAPPSPLEAFPLPGASGEDVPLSDREDPGERASGPAAFDPLPPMPELEAPARRTGAGLGATLGWLLVVLVVVIAAVLFMRSRFASSAGRQAAAVPTVAPAPSDARSSAAPGIAPSVPAPTPALGVKATGAPAGSAVTPRPGAPALPSGRPAGTESARAAATAAPSPRPISARPTAGVSAAPAAAPGSRGEWLSRAAREKKQLAADPRTRYSIQLELACEVPSLVEAWKHDRPGGGMWLLTTPHGSRECFRVLWGRYSTLEAARRGKSGIPSFFVTSSNHPAVVSVR